MADYFLGALPYCVQDGSEMASARSGAFYYRRLAREGSKADVRRVLLELTEEHERLREWVREQGMIPPRWSLAPGQLEDLRDFPGTACQRSFVDQVDRNVSD